MRRALLLLALPLLAACEDPPPRDPAVLADIACRGMPGISVEAAGRAFLRHAADPEELALWDEEPYMALAIEEIGLNGYGVIRAGLRCELVSLSDTEAVLMRREPDLTGFTPFKRKEVYKLETVEREVRFEVVDTPEGVRMRSGAAAAREELAAARAEAEAGEHEAAVQRVQALQARFPDPLLRWELMAFDELAKQDREGAQLELVVEEELLWAVNRGPEALPEGVLHLDCAGQQLEERRPGLELEGRVALAVSEVDLDPGSCSLRRALPW